MGRALSLLVMISACDAADSQRPIAEDVDRPHIEEPTLLDLGAAYLDSPEIRRAALAASLVDPGNGYSALRLANYGIVDRWDGLPLWNPPVRPITAADLGGPASAALAPLDLDIDWTSDALIELGARAFESYPLSIRPEFTLALASPVAAADYGLWTDDRGRVGGILRIDLGAGVEGFASTCATCHARLDVAGALVHGAGSPSIDVGRLRADYYGIPELAAWGPGHVDTTRDVAMDPIGIPDLRPLRHQRQLNAAATIDNSFLALVIRVETLMITSGESRPPRLIPLAVAMYLWSLGAPTPPPALDSGAERGQQIYARECASCHGARHRPGPPVAASVVGTDPLVAASRMRGTGDRYRVPSLFRVGERQQLLHLGAVGGLDELLDPTRLSTTPGHPYGTDLDASSRADLATFLETL